MEQLQWERTNDAVEFQLRGARGRIEIINESIFHLLYTREEKFGARESAMILPQKRSSQFEASADEKQLTIRTPKLQLKIDLHTAAFTWLDGGGNLLVREPQQGGKHLEPIPVEKRIFDTSIVVLPEKTADGIKARVAGAKVVIDRQAWSTKLDFVFADDEAIYGLGQHEEGILNYRGHSQFLYQQNMKVAMPMIVSTRGYGILWDTSALSVFHDDIYGSYFWTEVDDEMDFYFIAGPEFDNIVSAVRTLTGKPTMFPRWAYGYIQSKERYRTQDELLEIAREYRRREIPLDCVVLDWCSWTGNFWGDKNPDPVRFPDVTQLMNDLHEINARLMVSIWPIMRGGCPNQVEMRERGFLLGNDGTYNAFDPAARELYWKQANAGWFRHGVDAWWCDCTEPFEADWKGGVKPEPFKRTTLNTNESKTFLDPEKINEYSMHHSRGIYEHQRATSEDKRVVNLTRSGHPGQQRYGAITWSGDITAKWSTLRNQIADGLNFCVTGNPKWTFDIGAFFVGQKEQWFWRGDYANGCDDPGYRELYTRWLQLGTFLPMMRSHGTDTPREVWRFGEKGEPFYDALVKSIQLRYQLLPYIYSIAAWETLFDYTMMRLLAFDFRSDPRVHNIKDQFMFGPNIMVCPVLEPGASKRDVYLPEGCDWYDFQTNQRHRGGQHIIVPISLDHIPLVVRSGSILPLGPIVQHAADGLDQPIDLRIYPGADGSFILYVDENDNYNYEKGAYSTIEIKWDDAKKRLTIGERKGSFNGMKDRQFQAALVSNPGSKHLLRCGAEVRLD